MKKVRDFRSALSSIAAADVSQLDWGGMRDSRNSGTEHEWKSA